MTTFAEQLRDWQLFYSTVSLAAATLAGLLFVSLSLHPNVIRGGGEKPLLVLARKSFGDYLYVLMLGLVFLVPHQVPLGLAVALFALGASRGIGFVRQWQSSPRQRGKWTPAHGLREIVFPALASGGLVIVGIEVLRGDMVAIYGLVIVIAALLASASWNAWLILVEEEVGA